MSWDSKRFWKKCILQVIRKIDKSLDIEEEHLNSISKMYENCGGSWISLAKGDVNSWSLLRRLCKVYLKRCDNGS